MPPSHLAPGSVFAGEYRIVRALAQGGMGAVYVAEQLSTGRARALKVMRWLNAPTAKERERFVAEARVSGKIRSEHVVEVIAAGVDDSSGVPWLAMELLEGETLEAWSQQRAPISNGKLLTLFSQLCHGIGAAHRAGIVHRDLKPSNIFVARSMRADEGATVKVLDFGIAKLVDEQRRTSTASASIGTPGWMAPEQFSQRQVQPATDVWALGLIAFQLVTGRAYWLAANRPETDIGELIAEMLRDALVPASVRAQQLGAPAPPAGFDRWFARTVARSPADRYVDATEAFEGLRSALAGEIDAAIATTADRTTPGRESVAMFAASAERTTSPIARDIVASGTTWLARGGWRVVSGAMAVAGLLLIGTSLVRNWGDGQPQTAVDGGSLAPHPTASVNGARSLVSGDAAGPGPAPGCRTIAQDSFHLRPTPVLESVGSVYPVGTSLEVLARGHIQRQGQWIHRVRVIESGAMGYVFLGPGELRGCDTASIPLE